jgi:hypothetical protein
MTAFGLNRRAAKRLVRLKSVLIAAYGNDENDTAALTVIKHLFPATSSSDPLHREL